MTPRFADDDPLRSATFEWLTAQVQAYGDVLDWSVINDGFKFNGRQVRLVRQEGIYTPADHECALSVATFIRQQRGPSTGYEDHQIGQTLFGYRYKTGDPDSRPNRAVRRAMELGKPLVYLIQVSAHPSRFFVAFPVYVVHDNRAESLFHLQVDPDVLSARPSTSEDNLYVDSKLADIRRAYGTRLTKTRLHQGVFREHVLKAYQEQCAMCSLRHRRLLDAAHIDGDTAPEGEPVISNGLSLCKIHHAAFDLGMMGVRPEGLRVVVRPSVMSEKDGPMLLHGLQALDGQRINLPTRSTFWPDPERLKRHLDRTGLAG